MSRVEYTTSLDFHSLRNKKRDWLIETLVVMGRLNLETEKKIAQLEDENFRLKKKVQDNADWLESMLV